MFDTVSTSVTNNNKCVCLLLAHNANDYMVISTTSKGLNTTVMP